MTTDLVGHSDRPLNSLEEDSLGLGPYAKGLAQFVRTCDTPFTVAVQGDWGTGKTSLMRMVESLVAPANAPKGQPSIQAVWFQTWQYSQFGSMAALPVSLLATLLKCLSGEQGSVDKAKQVMSRLIKPVANAALRFGSMGASELGDFEGVLAQQAVDSASHADQLKTEIGELVERRLASGVDRIVIFIDDLDRIRPAIAVEILETIKLFVDWPGCVFVLALDYGVVSRGLSEKFGVGEQDLGRSFFDKIIQLPFTVPVARFTVDKFIHGLFQSMELDMRAEDSELFADLVRWSVSVNPRGIKRVFNSLQLLINMTEVQSDRLAIRILFAVLCLQIGYEPVYNWLLARGENLTGSNLMALAEADGGVRDADLTSALAKVTDARRDDYVRFATAFLSCVQNPDGEDNDIDTDELERIKSTLALSRVTSVQGKPEVKALTNDPEFRWQNRQLMNAVKIAFDEAVRPDEHDGAPPSWINTAHSTSDVWLKRAIGDGTFQLVAVHGEREIALYVEGGRRAIQSHEGTIKDALAPVADPYEEGDGTGPLFLRRIVTAGTGIPEREAMLLGEVRDAYSQAYRRLGSAL